MGGRTATIIGWGCMESESPSVPYLAFSGIGSNGCQDYAFFISWTCLEL